MDVRRNDNLESNRLTSILLKICSLLQVAHVETDVDVEVKSGWRFTSIYTIATIVTSVTDSIGYHSLHGSIMGCSFRVTRARVAC